jgi:hypothetical protein
VPNTVVFLWISAGALSVTTPPPRAAADLRDYGAARGLSLTPAVTRAPARGLPADDARLGDALEADLEQARTALSALEEGAADARLKQVEGQLLAHPYLPQAAFLMGECLALQARAARDRSPAVARVLDARRVGLEGPRAVAFGESGEEDPIPAHRRLPVRGLEPRDDLEVDGVSRGRTRHVELTAGLHHLRVLRGGRVVFATFTEVVPEQAALSLAPPSIAPCSSEDLLAAPEDGESHVECPRWAKVRDEPPGIGVALCERERCGAFVHWQRRPPEPFTPLTPERRGVPAWVGLAVAGASIAAGALVLWQSGAFDRSRPSAATWEYGGLNPQGVRF